MNFADSRTDEAGTVELKTREGRMSNKDYILNELKLMRRQCERFNMSPVKWIAQNADKYYSLYGTRRPEARRNWRSERKGFDKR